MLGEIMEIQVKLGETWNLGYRPTKVRITWLTTGGVFGDGNWFVFGKDTIGTNIFSAVYPSSLDEFIITWNEPNDFSYIQFQSDMFDPPVVLTISNIEWYIGP